MWRRERTRAVRVDLFGGAPDDADAKAPSAEASGAEAPAAEALDAEIRGISRVLAA
ncbi:hypothetical protein [Streptomyces arboris]|uniref:hypothetical protein n=1 Tax=Streptomyces arboris TaxID=2600619 RepID=UPI003BF475DA